MYGAGHLLSSHKEINEPAPFAIYLNSPYLTLLPRAVGSYLKWRLAAPLHGRLTPPRFSPSCPHCLSLWLGRSIIVPRWNLRKTVCRRPLSGPMESLMPVCFFRRLSSRIVRCRLPPGWEPHPGMYFSNWLFTFQSSARASEKTLHHLSSFRRRLHQTFFTL